MVLMFTFCYIAHQIKWFEGFKLRSLLFHALKDEHSAGYLGFQEAVQVDEGIWTWRPLQARGAAAISIVSYVLAAVGARADLLHNIKL